VPYMGTSKSSAKTCRKLPFLMLLFFSCSHETIYRPDADRRSRVQVTGLAKHNDNITRHEAEPAFSVAIIVATSLYTVDPRADPNHDADIRIGSEAPKQRLPNLFLGMIAMHKREQPLPRIVLGRSSPSSAVSPKFEFSLSPIACVVFAIPYAADLNWKPSGTKPVFT